MRNTYLGKQGKGGTERHDRQPGTVCAYEILTTKMATASMWGFRSAQASAFIVPSHPIHWRRWRKRVDQYLDALCKELDYVADRFRDKKLKYRLHRRRYTDHTGALSAGSSADKDSELALIQNICRNLL